MLRITLKTCMLIILIISTQRITGQEELRLNDEGYFHKRGLDITVFSDYYPDGHQSGVTIIQHGTRVAANGDIRLEPAPGQWSPVPKGGKKEIDPADQRIIQTMWFPDSTKNRVGFNPIDYPDLILRYQVSVTLENGNSVRVTVNLEEPLPSEWVGKVGFNLELFPGDLFGKSFLLDDQFGLFPDQPAGEILSFDDEPVAAPLATGSKLVVAPEEKLQRMVIESRRTPLELWDGRLNHNNGWYIVRSLVPGDQTDSVIEWIITPNTVDDWLYTPVIQASQLGYHPEQKKIAVVELDMNDVPETKFQLFKLSGKGQELVLTGTPDRWGQFLRYQYVTLDFSHIQSPGIYQLAYGAVTSHPFLIDPEVYGNSAWQPTLDYYLPVQMCHMRINEKYRVWHDLCHMDDAQMAPHVPYHFDGYRQGPENYTSFEAGESVPDLNQGGWHDAGDYDLRVESQAGTVWMLALMFEEFKLDRDATMIDHENHLVEIHQPDGVPDAIQQIEHGLASILGGYRSLGRLYRGIICSDLRQYVMLGDAASMTDNLPGNADDRWVFTEQNPGRELQVIQALAAASRVLKPFKPELADESLEVALALWKGIPASERLNSRKVIALSELILTIGDPQLMNELIDLKDVIVNQIDQCGWAVGNIIQLIDDTDFRKEVAEAVKTYQEQLQQEQASDSPYGVPYTPNIWGAGWNIQRFGVQQYFYHKGWPDLTTPDFFQNALHFILGVHPGSNNASFASGIGSKSIKVAYGVNRADWSFIPGGVVSGTALIRPDFPELKTWPFLWQQTEYVMGGGATNYMFLVLAVDSLFDENGE